LNQVRGMRGTPVNASRLARSALAARSNHVNSCARRFSCSLRRCSLRASINSSAIRRVHGRVRRSHNAGISEEKWQLARGRPGWTGRPQKHN
jgi:hypothetical protein